MSGVIDIQASERNLYRIVESIISMVRKWNASGQVTLTPGGTTTVVTKTVSKGAVNVSMDDEIVLSPRTANAAAAVTNVYVSAVVQGGFTLTHANTATVDRTFGWGAR